MSKLFRVIVAGGRDFLDIELMKKKLDSLLREKSKTHSIVIINGGAKGADAMSSIYAWHRDYDTLVVVADWEGDLKEARPKRNLKMAQMADAAVVFWDGKSKDTKDMIDKAKWAGIPVRIIRYQPRNKSRQQSQLELPR